MTKGPMIALLGLVFLAFVNAANVNRNDLKVTDAINNFGIELYKELSRTNDNLVFSGYSISSALNMLLVGARGNTEKEIRSALGYSSPGSQDVESFHRILKLQREKSNGYSLDVANSMWIQENFEVLPEFKSKVQKLFFASQEEVDFKNSLATDRINDWVKQETKDMIPKLFDERLDDNTKMVLVNAMYFKGSWITKFEKNMTENRTFRYGSQNRDIPMMKVVGKFPYHESKDLDAQVLELPYDGDDVSMVFVLPKAVNGLNSLHRELNLERVTSVLNELDRWDEEKVTVTIPKFESSSTLELNDVLKSLGIKEAFSRNADLSGINGKDNLFVSKAIQKAVIEVSEEGTVAAAASGIEIQTKMIVVRPENIIFTADHPFLYFIRHRPTGLLLFLGSKTKP